MIIVPNMKIEKCKCSDGCVGYDYDPYKEKNIETCKKKSGAMKKI